MRVSDPQERTRVNRFSRHIIAAIALSGNAMPSMAADLFRTPHHLWVSATALSLTLVTAALKPKH
jgi:hypothetical protein